MDYKIRFANIEDEDSIMKFIDMYWKTGHILSTNKELFEWQYINNNRLNFVLGIDDNNSIQGVLGFIPYNDTKDKDIALALWKANPSASFLGIRLIMFLIKEEPHRNIICNGINMGTTSKIYQQLGMHVGSMTQWYRLNKRDNYKVAEIINNEIPKYNENNQGRFVLIDSLSKLKKVFDSIDNNLVPYKSFEYIKKRYFAHPSYQYMVYGLELMGKIRALFVFRIQECNDSQVMRFVDCIGSHENIMFATEAIDGLLDNNCVEYIDMYEAGIKDDILKEAGWIKVKESGNIIPNYFAPYDKRIVDIFYCASNDEAILFRGDGDQDRPN